MRLPQADAADRAALAAEFARAQADADRRFGAGPPPLWRPTGSQAAAATTRPRTKLWAVGALSLLAIGTAVVGRALMMPPVPTAAQTMVAAVPVETPEDAVLDTGEVSPPVPKPATSVFTVNRDGTGWRIDAAGANRLGAAQRLAQLGAGTLHGNLGLLTSSRTLDLRWQGRRLADAWPAVLGGEASYALQCGRERCAVWLIAAGAATPTTRDSYGAAVALPSAAPLHSAAATRTPAPFPVSAALATGTESSHSASPSDSADPRVAAHHD